MKKLNVLMSIILGATMGTPSYAQMASASETVGLQGGFGIISSGPKEGNSGGGGSTIPSRPAEKHEVEFAIKNVHIFARYILNYARSNYQIRAHYQKSRPGSNFVNDADVMTKKIFFNPNKNVWDILRKLKIDIRGKGVENKKCEFDGAGYEGSANTMKNEICLSVSEIYAKNYDVNLIDTKVMGIFIHEFAHLFEEGSNVALNETEARKFQEEFDSGSVSINFRKLSELIVATSDRLADRMANFKETLDKRNTDTEVCTLATIEGAALVKDGLSLPGALTQYSNLSLYGEALEAQGLAVMHIIQNSLNACVRPTNKYYTSDRAFGSSTELSLHEILEKLHETRIDKSEQKSFYTKIQQRVYEGTRVGLVRSGDYYAMRQQLDVAEKMLQKFAAQVKRLPKLDEVN